MPVYLKDFYIKQLSDTLKKENDAVNKQNKESPSINKLNIPRNPRFKT
tara:strand:+ start:1101 stop:1244 length:144 start_codon:yes stop_codon:yes gene_type:complete